MDESQIGKNPRALAPENFLLLLSSCVFAAAIFVCYWLCVMGTVRSLLHLMQYDHLLEIPTLNSAVLPVDYCEEAFFLSCIVYLIKIMLV